MNPQKVTFALLFALLTTSCGTAKIAERQDDVFAQAVEASLSDNHEVTAAAAYRYVVGTSSDDPRYDRAMRLLAQSSEKLGFTYAASLWYLEIASARRDPEVVGDAIRGLERIIREHPHNQFLLIDGFVATADIDGLPVDAQAFVYFHQGLDSLRRGYPDWAAQLFAQIPRKDPYRLRARYILAVDIVADYELEEAKVQLERLLEVEDAPPDVVLNARRTLARIAFEEKRYDIALGYYETMRDEAKDDPSLLLEMAWCHFYLGNLERALGLLIALDAPAYDDLIAPERYLLEALTLQNLCQFEPARKAAVRLRQRHGNALEDLNRGVPLDESQALRNAASLRPGSSEIIAFRERVEFEAKQVDRMKRRLGEELTEGLTRVYAHGTDEAERVETAEIGAEMRRVSQELLAAEEGVRLILHELGVALLRGRKRTVPTGADPTDTIGPLDVVYRFDSEFWTDEVDDLVVRMEDRCID